jgi:hypothetical protein
MLLLGIVLLLVLAAGVIAILARRRPEIGSTWIIASGAGLLAWLIMAGSPFRFFQEISLSGWLPFTSQALEFKFQIEKVSWPYVVSILSLNVAVLLTSSARIHVKNESYLWAGSLLLSAIGLMACSAISPLSLILTWTLLDIAELGFILFIRADRKIESAGLASFTWRVFGTLILAGVTIMAAQGGLVQDFKDLPGAFFPAIFFAVVLRLGIFPLHPGISRYSPINRSAGNVINLIAPASALVLLGRLPAEKSIDSSFQLLAIFFLLYAIFMAYKWATSTSELNGRPFWIFCGAMLAILTAGNGNPQLSPVWGTIVLIGGGSLFLASPRNKWILVLLMIVFFGISGIPGSPTMTAWNGLVQGSPIFELPLILVTTIGLFYGFIKFSQMSEGSFSNVDRWVKVVFPAGFGILILTQWFIFIRGLPTSLSFEYWWCGITVLILTLLILLWGLKKLPAFFYRALDRIKFPKVAETEKILDTFFGFGWMTRINDFLFGFIQRIVTLITSVLEGEGGILWAIVLLVLMISYFQLGLQP